MARRRFLVEAIRGGQAVLRGDDARHLARVLRTEPGRQYEISDGAGLYLAEVSVVGRDTVTFKIVEPIEAARVPLHLTLFAALIKFDRFEWLVEKATELGAAAIVPVNAARSEKGLCEAARKRMDRWRRIAHESAQQCRRMSAPEISEPRQFAGVLDAPQRDRYFMDEEPGAAPLAHVLPPPDRRTPSDSVALLAGPEGGWTEAERAAAADGGWKQVSLGPLVLRAETAAIAGAAFLAHSWWASQLE